ncbi:MAG: histidinol-phosphatase [Clostridia bacterium]|nr:histidinol-phosphatase [Clostridia bacterium]
MKKEPRRYCYETHLHTSPVSKCARATVRETLAAYAALGYDGVFITNHFLDGNINIDRSLPYEERVRFYFSDYKEGVRLGEELGIRVFCGVEMSYGGTDFLVYGLTEAWYLAHPEIEAMKRSDLLTLLAEAGALIIQAHPFREAAYIDHIRLFPRHVHGVETYNACRTPLENEMAEIYARYYALPAFSGSDNHRAGAQPKLGGMSSPTPIADERDFIDRFRKGELSLIKRENETIKQ